MQNGYLIYNFQLRIITPLKCNNNTESGVIFVNDQNKQYENKKEQNKKEQNKKEQNKKEQNKQ